MLAYCFGCVCVCDSVTVFLLGHTLSAAFGAYRSVFNSDMKTYISFVFVCFVDIFKAVQRFR